MSSHSATECCYEGARGSLCQNHHQDLAASERSPWHRGLGFRTVRLLRAIWPWPGPAAHPSSGAGPCTLLLRAGSGRKRACSSVVRQFPSSLHLSCSSTRQPSLRPPSFRPPRSAPRSIAPASLAGACPWLVATRFHQPSHCPDTLSLQRITPSIYVFKGFGKIYWACCPPSVHYTGSRELSSIKLLSPTESSCIKPFGKRAGLHGGGRPLVLSGQNPGTGGFCTPPCLQLDVHASPACFFQSSGLAWSFSTHTQCRALLLQKAQPWAWMGFSQCKNSLHDKVNNPRVLCVP